MSTNELEQQMIQVGIAMPALRRALRLTRDGMIAAGPGATAGVHDFGVFYVHRNKQRYVLRDGEVYDVPQRDVLKLRPAKSTPTKLTESPEVRITTTWDLAPSVSWEWKSTSLANRFEVISPPAHSGNAYDWVRQDYENETTYAMVKASVSDADLNSTPGQRWTGSDELLVLRLTKSLMGIVEAAAAGSSLYAIENLGAFADTNGSPPLFSISDATEGGEALAWCRQRAIDIADR